MPVKPTPYIVESRKMRDLFLRLNQYYRFKCFMGDPNQKQAADIVPYLSPLSHIPHSLLYDKTAWKGGCWLYTLSKDPTTYLKAALFAARQGWASTVVLTRVMSNKGWFWDLAFLGRIKCLLGHFYDLSGNRIDDPMMLVVFPKGCFNRYDPARFLPDPSDSFPEDELLPPKRSSPRNSPATGPSAPSESPAESDTFDFPAYDSLLE